VDARLGLFGDGLLTSEEPRHLRQRRLMQPAFHHERVQSYAATVVECANEIAAEWRQAAGSVRDVAHDMNRLTLEVICRTMFGASAQGEAHAVSERLETVIAMLNRLVLPLGKLRLSLPLPETRRYFRSLQGLDDLVMRLIDDRRRSPVLGQDLLGMLLAARDPDTGQGLSDRELRDEVMTIFVAGHETTANALAWAWYLLSVNPAVRATLEAELDTVLQGRAPTPADYPQLRYTQAVVKESLRLYPAVWIMGRRALRPVTAGPLHLNTGDIALVCMYTLHRRPALYSEPLCFRPERWLDESFTPHKFGYLPFGAGSRLCIGERFAWMEAGLILATLAQGFQLGLLSREPPPALAQLTLRPEKGLPAVITPRA
jgi:cytochrome P450